MGSVEKYKRICIMGLKNTLEYRANYLTNLISIIFPIIIQYFIWSAVFRGKDINYTVFGYTYIQMITYTLTAGFIARLLSSGFHHEVSNDIKSGSFSRFLVQPIKYFCYRAAYFIGEKSSEFLIILSIITVMLTAMTPILGLKISIMNVVLFLADIIPAMILMFFMFFCISLIAFWIIEVGHVYGVIEIMTAIASGSIFPLDIFGQTAVNIMNYLPFLYTTYFLTNILCGKIGFGLIIKGFLVQLIWIIVMSVICFMLWKQGIKKYVSVGG